MIRPGQRVWIRLKQWRVDSVKGDFAKIRPVGGTDTQVVSVHVASIPKQMEPAK